MVRPFFFLVILIGSLVIAFAGGCAEPSPPPLLTSPSPTPTAMPDLVRYAYTLDGRKLTYQDLPLSSLIASANDAEFAEVGLTRAQALSSTATSSLWMLHRSMPANQKEARSQPPPEEIASGSIVPKLNLAFLTANNPTITIESEIPEGYRSSFKRTYIGALKDAAVEAAREVFSAINKEGTVEIVKQYPRMGDGILSIFLVYYPNPKDIRMTVRRRSPLVGDIIDIRDLDADLLTETLYEQHISKLTELAFPSRATTPCVQKYAREWLARRLFDGIGIDTLKIRHSGMETPLPYVYRCTASGSVGVGSRITGEAPKDAIGSSYLVEPSDLVFEEGGKVYVQTSIDIESERDARQVLGRLARMAAKKIAPTVRQ